MGQGWWDPSCQGLATSRRPPRAGRHEQGLLEQPAELNVCQYPKPSWHLVCHRCIPLLCRSHSTNPETHHVAESWFAYCKQVPGHPPAPLAKAPQLSQAPKGHQMGRLGGNCFLENSASLLAGFSHQHRFLPEVSLASTGPGHILHQHIIAGCAGLTEIVLIFFMRLETSLFRS